MRPLRLPCALAALLALLGPSLTSCAPTAGPSAAESATAAECAPGARAVPPGTAELQSALDAAAPGDVLQLSPVVYAGRFRVSAAGTQDRPIVLCGVTGAIIDGGGTADGYALHLDGASYWQVRDLVVRGAQKGVVTDGASHLLLSNLRISDVGQEGLHLRAGSVDNVVQDVVVENTGLDDPTYGEGVYVGSAESNWCRYTACEPDRSDRNVFERVEVRDTTAEALDIKEGTTGGVVRASVFSVADDAVVDSVIDIKGSGWTVQDSTVAGSEDAVSVHVIVAPWGADNTVVSSTLRPAGGGVGVNLVGDARSTGNVVACDNTVDAGVSLANVPCR